MDVRMPRMDGIEATRQPRASPEPDGGPSVLVLTTFDLDENVYAALRAGASGFLLKDAPRHQLIHAVRTLADVAGYSEATLNRRFRAELGLPPMAFVTACRMRLARRLLRSTGLTIAQIARRCGIGDPYYFSRLFRDHHGDPPTVWRRVRQL